MAAADGASKGPLGDFLASPPAYYTAGVCCLFAIILSLAHLRSHLRSFAHPKQQTQIIRCLFMVPIYSTGAWLSLTFPEKEMWFDTIRDCYEAVTIYSFLQLLLAYIGGESAVCVHFRDKGTMRAPPPVCCMRLVLDHRFLRLCKQWTIQFVFLKPIMAAATIVLDMNGLYVKDTYSLTGGFLYVQVVYNISYTLALYGLGLFYGACKQVLAPHRPIRKFLVVKAVIFLSFWQGFWLSVIANFSTTINSASNLQSYIICVEMALAAFLHFFAFPASEYHEIPEAFGDGDEYGYDWTSSSLGGHSGSCFESTCKVLNIHDIFTDAYNNYNSRYTEYTLQSDVAGSHEVLEIDMSELGDTRSTSSAESGGSSQDAQPVLPAEDGEAPQPGSPRFELGSAGEPLTLKPGLMRGRTVPNAKAATTVWKHQYTPFGSHKGADEFGDFVSRPAPATPPLNGSPTSLRSLTPTPTSGRASPSSGSTGGLTPQLRAKSAPPTPPLLPKAAPSTQPLLPQDSSGPADESRDAAVATSSLGLPFSPAAAPAVTDTPDRISAAAAEAGVAATPQSVEPVEFVELRSGGGTPPAQGTAVEERHIDYGASGQATTRDSTADRRLPATSQRQLWHGMASGARGNSTHKRSPSADHMLFQNIDKGSDKMFQRRGSL